MSAICPRHVRARIRVRGLKNFDVRVRGLKICDVRVRVRGFKTFHVCVHVRVRGQGGHACPQTRVSVSTDLWLLLTKLVVS